MMYYILLYYNHSMNWSESSWEDLPKENPIYSNYLRWCENYAVLSKLSRRRNLWPAEKEYNEEQIIDYQKLVVDYCERALAHTGTCREQCIKIRAFLLLHKVNPVGLYNWESYFYGAVELALRYWKDEPFQMCESQIILSTYLEWGVQPSIFWKFPKKFIQSLTPLFFTAIRWESSLRTQKKQENRWDIQNYAHDTPGNLLERIENLFGPVRLLILSKKSDEIITRHRIGLPEATFLKNTSKYIHSLTVYIFDKPVEYRVIMDYGSDEWWNQFEEGFWKNIIQPLLRIYIERIEEVLFIVVSEYGSNMTAYEAGNTGQEKWDYTLFIASLLWSSQVRNSWEEVDKRESYLQALDICQLVLSQYRNNPNYASENLSEHIDKILWRKTNREVFWIVTLMLLSRNETMNGAWYPFWLRKNDIPLSGRIFPIIHAYETIFWMYPNNYKKIISTLLDWWEKWLFDTEILSLFIDSHQSGEILQLWVQNTRSWGFVSSNREEEYKIQMKKWNALIQGIDDIEKTYDSFRVMSADNVKRKSLAEDMIKQRLSLHEIAGLRTIWLLGRHEEAPSDVDQLWVPEILVPLGGDNELLTSRGKDNAYKKWTTLQNLAFHFDTSPLPRARDTARLICQWVNNCFWDCECHKVQCEDVLKNPQKNLENLRAMSYVWKFVDDDPKWLIDFVFRIVSGARHPICYIITHGDVLPHLLFIIHNLFSQNGFTATRDPVGHDNIYTLLFQWDSVIEWNLIFSVTDWNNILSTINIFSQDAFWEPFFERKDQKIDLIKLHDKFLDFLDFHREDSPEKSRYFIQQIHTNPTTRHLSKIFRWVRSISPY